MRAVGILPALAALDEAIGAAFQEARWDLQDLDVACLGLAGADRPDEKAMLRSWAHGRNLTRHLVLVNDGDLVLAAASREGCGAAVISGTGSIAVGRGRNGQTARAGGWGYLFGDEGSAYAVALAGLRLVVRRADGRSPSSPGSLDRRLMAALDVTHPSELVAAVYGEPLDRAAIAALAPVVVAVAKDDPEVLSKILQPAGRDLAECVLAIARAIGWDHTALPLGLAGSFLLAADPVREALLATLRESRLEPVPVQVPEPVVGAIHLARQALEDAR
jgi:N-acetylglucosamine kinase-like BadF-type ATPase